LERLFKQLEQRENGKLYFKKGTHYNSQDFTHISKGELVIPFMGGYHELSFQSLQREGSTGYKHHLHSYVNRSRHTTLFIVAPRKAITRMVKPKAPWRYRLLCPNEEVNALLRENESINELYLQAEAAKIAPWIQGRTESNYFVIKTQYITEASSESFFTSAFETLKRLMREFNQT